WRLNGQPLRLRPCLLLLFSLAVSFLALVPHDHAVVRVPVEHAPHARGRPTRGRRRRVDVVQRFRNRPQAFASAATFEDVPDDAASTSLTRRSTWPSNIVIPEEDATGDPPFGGALFHGRIRPTGHATTVLGRHFAFDIAENVVTEAAEGEATVVLIEVNLHTGARDPFELSKTLVAVAPREPRLIPQDERLKRRPSTRAALRDALESASRKQLPRN